LPFLRADSEKPDVERSVERSVHRKQLWFCHRQHTHTSPSAQSTTTTASPYPTTASLNGKDKISPSI
jgi:hypothetical protein